MMRTGKRTEWWVGIEEGCPDELRAFVHERSVEEGRGLVGYLSRFRRGRETSGLRMVLIYTDGVRPVGFAEVAGWRS